MNMVICLSKFGITNLVIPMSLLRKIELLTKANSKPRFFHSLSSLHKDLASFLAGVKQTFTNFFKSHHNLESSRVTPSHLGGFISKSNKCHKE
jgi:hypothetical protein